MQTIFVILGLLSFLFGGVTGLTVEGFHIGGASFMACGVVLAGVSAHDRYFRPPSQAVKVGRRGVTRSFMQRRGEKGILRGGRFLIFHRGTLIGTIEREFEFRVGDEVTFWQSRNPDTIGTIDEIQIPGPRDHDAIYRVSSPRGPHWLPPNRLKLWSSTEH